MDPSTRNSNSIEVIMAGVIARMVAEKIITAALGAAAVIEFNIINQDIEMFFTHLQLYCTVYDSYTIAELIANDHVLRLPYFELLDKLSSVINKKNTSCNCLIATYEVLQSYNVPRPIPPVSTESA